MQRERRVGRKTVYTYVILHSAAKWSLERARASADGSFYAEILTILSTAFFVEAYLNHAGTILLPDVWAKLQWEEPKEKLKRICDSAHYPLDTESAEYRSFIKAFRLRNFLAHGRTQTVSGTWKLGTKGPNVLSALRVDWEKELEGTVAANIVKDCETLVREIQAAAGWQEDPFAVSSRGMSGEPPNKSLQRTGKQRRPLNSGR